MFWNFWSFLVSELDENGSLPYTTRVIQSSQNLLAKFRSKPLQIYFKIGALKSFAIFTGKHLCWSLFIEHLRWLLLYITGVIFLFLICYLAAVPQLTLDHYRGKPDLNHVSPECHQEPHNGVGSLSAAERLVRLEPGTFPSNPNALTHKATLIIRSSPSLPGKSFQKI